MDKFTKRWVQHLRNTSRQATPPRNPRCPLCDAAFEPNLDAFKAHVRSNSLKHATFTGDTDVEEAFKTIVLQEKDGNEAPSSTVKPSPDTQIGCVAAGKRPVSGNVEQGDPAGDELDRLKLASDGTLSSRRGSKRRCSPPASFTQQHGSPPLTPSRGKAQQRNSIDDFDRGLRQRNQTARQLWVPDDDRREILPPATRTNQTRQGAGAGPGASSSTAHRRPPRQRKRWRHHHLSNETSWSPMRLQMPHQPNTRSITSDQLLSEVKGIYAGLILLEAKCIEYDTTLRTVDLNDNQYHAMISLHQSLLHEHHDFYLSSHHPSACDALQEIAVSYAMPARMWRHGIHSFLELLRLKLPGSLEYLLLFIYIAYSSMALLMETVPKFRATWIECLGDLGRYRMAIDDNGQGSRELWTGVAKYWYIQASDDAPTVGRLYHHLAILARGNMLQQLFLYSKSLCVQVPFESAKDSITTLFKPLMDPKSSANQQSDPVYAAFVRVHGILFLDEAMDQIGSSMSQFVDSLDDRIGTERRDWIESGYYVGISLGCLILGFGDKSSLLMQALSSPSADDAGENEERRSDDTDSDTDSGTDDVAPCELIFDTAISFAAAAYKVVLRRQTDENTLACVHTILAFFFFMSKRPAALKLLDDRFPWHFVAVYLNHMLETSEFPPRIDTMAFPGPEKQEAPRPLPEDYAMHGLIYTEDYFPANWFDNDKIEEDEKYIERPSTMLYRRERVLWIGRMIARQERWLVWDDEEETFGVPG
ncbi:hypothetical protein E4U42_005777 [Claviceps africana]|uniref:DNA/RNA-binding domain-containing protein n=1 Tax=Claviceps africana TaxID=83212 RepID=A0A8K0NFC4_9HYPO|nr:hypothetical protein E4U42_005777 [Claviceps africana]